MKPSEFINEFYLDAKTCQDIYGTPYLIILSQAALESGWGKKSPKFNFFGIKAGKSWKGETQDLMTWEYENGKVVRKVQKFRAYENAFQSFEDHSKLLTKRFPKCYIYRDNLEKFVEGLTNKTIHGYVYATDPDYKDKILTIAKIIQKRIDRKPI